HFPTRIVLGGVHPVRLTVHHEQPRTRAGASLEDRKRQLLHLGGPIHDQTKRAVAVVPEKQDHGLLERIVLEHRLGDQEGACEEWHVSNLMATGSATTFAILPHANRVFYFPGTM